MRVRTKPIPGIDPDARILIERLSLYVTDRGAIVAHLRREGYRTITRDAVETVLATYAPSNRFLGQRVANNAEMQKTPEGFVAREAADLSARCSNDAYLGKVTVEINRHANVWGVPFHHAMVLLANSSVPA